VAFFLLSFPHALSIHVFMIIILGLQFFDYVNCSHYFFDLLIIILVFLNSHKHVCKENHINKQIERV
jgi:hypothetical protein